MGKFEIKETKSGGFTFCLKAGNNQVICTGQTYKKLPGCQKGVASVAVNAAVAAIEDQTVEGYAKEKHPKFEVYTDKAGETRFRLKAKNGQIIVSSEGYKTKKSCLKGIESIKKNAPEAPVTIKEEKK